MEKYYPAATGGERVAAGASVGTVWRITTEASLPGAEPPMTDSTPRHNRSRRSRTLEERFAPAGEPCGFLFKPFNLDILARAVRGVLDREPGRVRAG